MREIVEYFVQSASFVGIVGLLFGLFLSVASVMR
jgi:hypothetical protein